MKNPIPQQEQGSGMDIHAHTVFDEVDSAHQFYLKAKRKLLEAFRWHEVCKVPVSTFILTDSEGNEVKRDIQEGDHLKIDIPGPGTTTGDGYDWVQVESIFEEHAGDMELTSITVRPSANPKHTGQATAHFFKDSATSTFQVKRMGLEVHAEVHGRNELPNTHTPHLADNIRNTLVGWSAKLGLSYPQWKSLVSGLVERNEESAA